MLKNGMEFQRQKRCLVQTACRFLKSVGIQDSN